MTTDPVSYAFVVNTEDVKVAVVRVDNPPAGPLPPAVKAYDAVPNNEPVIEGMFALPVTEIDPVKMCLSVETSPKTLTPEPVPVTTILPVKILTFPCNVAFPVNEPVKEPVLFAAGAVAFNAYDAVTAYEDVIGTNVMLVAALAVVANDDVVGTNEIALATDAVPNREPVNDPVNDPELTDAFVGAYDAVAGMNVILVAALAVIATDDVPSRDPVNDPVNAPDGLAAVEFIAYDAVIAYDDVTGVNVILVAALDVTEYDAVTGVNVRLFAADAVMATDDVPNIDPVIDGTVNDPVIETEPVKI